MHIYKYICIYIFIYKREGGRKREITQERKNERKRERKRMKASEQKKEMERKGGREDRHRHSKFMCATQHTLQLRPRKGGQT